MTAMVCICGRACKSRSGYATHARACPAEKARRARYVEAIEQRRRPLDFHQERDLAKLLDRAELAIAEVADTLEAWNSEGLPEEVAMDIYDGFAFDIADVAVRREFARVTGLGDVRPELLA